MGFFGRFFQGRNGRDSLNIALFVLGIFLSFLSRFLFENVLSILSYIVLLLCIFRAISRNIPQRQAENALFLEATRGIRARFSPGGTPQGRSGRTGGGWTKKRRANSPYFSCDDFRYFSCPDCKQTMRVPKGQGKVKVTCPKCALVIVKEV